MNGTASNHFLLTVGLIAFNVNFSALRCLRKINRSIPFEYIEKDNGDDNFDIAEAVMEVDVDWDESEHGYKTSYYYPDMYKIDPAEGNGDERDFYEDIVEPIVLSRLESMGITAEALYGGLGR